MNNTEGGEVGSLTQTDPYKDLDVIPEDFTQPALGEGTYQLPQEDDEEEDVIEAAAFARLINSEQGRHSELISDRGDWDPSQEAVQDKYASGARLIALSSDSEHRLDLQKSSFPLPPKQSADDLASDTTQLSLNTQISGTDYPEIRVVGEPTIEMFRQISDDENFVALQPTEPSVVYKVLARCCGSYPLANKKIADQLGLDMTTHKGSPTPKAVYVGWSASLCEPVFFNVLDQPQAGPLLFRDDTTSVSVRSVPSNQQCQKNVIFQEDGLVVGNLAYIKRAILGELPEAEMRTFREILKRENDMISNGLIPSPVSKVRASARSPDMAPYFGSNYEFKGVDQYYKLMYPLLAALLIPKELITTVEGFLRNNPLDPMPLNIAIAAVIIFADLRQQGQTVEPFVQIKSKDTWTKKFELVTMTQSVIYFPHLLRFTEIVRNTRYTHPLRWAHQEYKRDSEADNIFKLENEVTQLPQDQLLEMVSRIKCRDGSQDPWCRRVHLLPQSMPGTRLIWPRDPTASALRPSETVAAMCLLNDINTLELPSYHYRKGPIQYIGAPYRLSARWLRQDPKDLYRLAETPRVTYWWPEYRPTIACLTGNTREVGPIFTDLSGDEQPHLPPLLGSDATQLLSKPKTLAELVSKPKRDEYSSFNNRLIRLAEAKGKRLQWDDKYMTLTFDGFENDVLDAQATGTLSTILKHGVLPSVPMPPFKKRKTDQHMGATHENTEQAPLQEASKLSPDDREECINRIKKMQPRANDWEKLLEQLHNKNVLVHTALHVLRDINVNVIDPLRNIIDAKSTNEEIHARIVAILRCTGVITRPAALVLDIFKDWDPYVKGVVLENVGPILCDALEICIILGQRCDNPTSKLMAISELDMFTAEVQFVKDQMSFVDEHLAKWGREECN